jgi:hypothetical protein
MMLDKRPGETRSARGDFRIGIAEAEAKKARESGVLPSLGRRKAASSQKMEFEPGVGRGEQVTQSLGAVGTELTEQVRRRGCLIVEEALLTGTSGLKDMGK